MRNLQVFTRCGKKTLPAFADAALQLILARRPAEIGGRPADVVDIALKPFLPCEQGGLGQEGIMTSGGHGSALMIG